MMDFYLGFLLGSISSRVKEEQESSEPYYPSQRVIGIVENDVRKMSIKGGWHITMMTKLDVIDHLGSPSIRIVTGTYITYEDPGEIITTLDGSVVRHSSKKGEMLVGISV